MVELEVQEAKVRATEQEPGEVMSPGHLLKTSIAMCRDLPVVQDLDPAHHYLHVEAVVLREPLAAEDGAGMRNLRESHDRGRLRMNLMLRWQIIGALLEVMRCRRMRWLVVLLRMREGLLLSQLVQAVLRPGMIWTMLI